MALADDLASLVTNTSNAYRTKMEAKYNLVANPQYVATELQKAGDVIGELFAEIVMPYIVANAELKAASLDDKKVSQTGTGPDTWEVDDGNVNGGVE